MKKCCGESSVRWGDNMGSENVKSVEPEFDLSPMEGKTKITITVAGEKGESKTTFALSVPGTIGGISLDLKTDLIREWLESIGKRKPGEIKVWDGVKYYTADSGDDKSIVKAGEKNYRYLNSLLDSIEGQYDWILLDGLEILHNICELVMRHNHKIGATEGFKEFAWWKERRMFLRTIHMKALKAARKGVIYTTYMEFVAELVENERTVTGKKHPKWVDVIMYETDVTVHCYHREDSVGKKRYYVKVMNSKRPTFIKDGITVEVSGPDYSKLFGANPVAVEQPEPKKPKLPSPIVAANVDNTKTQQQKEEGEIPF